MDSFKGTGVSPGIGLGKFHFVNNEIDLSIPSKISFKASQQQLDLKYSNLIEKLKKDNRNSEAEVLDAYRLLINDPEISDMINENHDLKEIFDIFKNTSDEMMKFEDEYFKQRAEDIISIGKEIIFSMQNIVLDQKLDEDVIIFAFDLTPNDTSSLDLTKVKGFVVTNSGPTSHAVIVAKNLGIPCVINFDISILDLSAEEQIVIDGDSGEIFINPDNKILNRVEESMDRSDKLKELSLIHI